MQVSQVTGTVALDGGPSAVCENIPADTNSTLLFVAKVGRKGCVVHNDSTAYLYLKYGTNAASTSYTYYIQPGGHWYIETPSYFGEISAIASAATGTWRCTSW